MEEMTGQKLVSELKRKGFSKYRIAKQLGIAFNTVDFWDRGIWEPNEVNLAALKKLITANGK